MQPSLLGEIICVYPLYNIGVRCVHANTVVHHQLGYLTSVDKDDPILDLSSVFARLFRVIGRGDEYPLSGVFALKSSCELLYLGDQQ